MILNEHTSHKHTNMALQLIVHIKTKMRSMRSKELKKSSETAVDQIWTDLDKARKKSAAFIVSKSSVVSIILIWEMFGSAFLLCFITKLKYFPIICPDFTDDDEDESEEEQTEVDCPREQNGMYFECDLACWYT